MLIKIKTLTGRILEVNMEDTDTVLRLKERVEEREGIPPIQQRMVFKGKALADESTLKDCNIAPGEVVHLVMALRG